jgi:hypothetical protein
VVVFQDRPRHIQRERMRHDARNGAQARQTLGEGLSIGRVIVNEQNPEF